VRYLIGSAHDWLGATGFQVAALKVAARERWMGWSDEQRRGHLDRVICLSRFLVRPMVRCRNLASHVLGRILRRWPGDFEARYGCRPWLVESFADEGYDGLPQGGQLPARGPHGGAWPAGSLEAARQDGEDGLHALS